MTRKRAPFVVAVLFAASAAWAGDASPKKAPTVSSGYPSPEPPRASSAEVKGPSRAPSAPGSSTNAGALQTVVLRSIAEGRAEVTVDGGAVSVRPGDALAGYTVTSISAGRIVLVRGVLGQTDATAILTFSAAGQARVRVYSTKDSTLPASSVAR